MIVVDDGCGPFRKVPSKRLSNWREVPAHRQPWDVGPDALLSLPYTWRCQPDAGEKLLETNTASISNSESISSAAEMGRPLAPDLHPVLEHIASHIRDHDGRCVDAQRVAVDADV